MRTSPFLSLILLSPLVSPAVLAQAPTATTSTDFGVVASDGTTTNQDAVASGTSIGSGRGGVSVHASIGNRTAGAGAASLVTGWRSFGPFGGSQAAGVLITETGQAHNQNATGTLSAGTSGDAPGSPSPGQGAHGVSVAYALAQSTAATVNISWAAHASAGAAVSGSVDVDGDGTPDWTSTPGTNERVQLAVTAGANGVTLGIETDGSASVTGAGRESYFATLIVTLSTSSTSPLTFTWSNSGPTCQGSLSGSETVRGRVVQLDFTVTGGVADGIGVLLLGAPAAAPRPLPSGTCDLLLDNIRPAALFFTDASGGGSARTFAGARATSVDFQAITFAFASGAMGSTDVLNLTVQ